LRNASCPAGDCPISISLAATASPLYVALNTCPLRWRGSVADGEERAKGL
jgi:hypothetical protein